MVMDLNEEWSARVDEDQRRSPSTTSQRQPNDPKKFCTDCHTATTPLWRGGPAGPKSLCNACGIKYHKKRRALLGLEKGRAEKTKKKSKSIINGTSSNNHGNSGSSCNINNNGDQEKEVRMESLKASNGSKMVALGEEMLLKKLNGSAGDQKKLLLLRGKLGEEEQAAILLMALSYGSVSA